MTMLATIATWWVDDKLPAGVVVRGGVEVHLGKVTWPRKGRVTCYRSIAEIRASDADMHVIITLGN